MEQEPRGRRHGENGPRAPVSSESKGRTGLRQKMRRLFVNKSEQAEPDSASVASPARTGSAIRQAQHRNSLVDRDLHEEKLPQTQSAAIQPASAQSAPLPLPVDPAPAVPLSPVLSSAVPPSAVLLSAAQSLWDQAYDALGQKNPALVKDYEVLLHREGQMLSE